MSRSPWVPILLAALGFGSGTAVLGLTATRRLRIGRRRAVLKGAILGIVNMAAPMVALTYATVSLAASVVAPTEG